jgi:NAD dependent epimerase/dehydratase family enzyme
LALDNPAVQGAVNGTAPEPVTNRDFAQALGRALHRPAVMPTPAFALRLMLGEAADIALTGQRVLPAKLVAVGYVFQFPTLGEAVAHALADAPAQ